MHETLWDAFEQSLRSHRERVAIVADGHRLSYGDLNLWSAAVASQLAAVGVGAGDSVGLYMRNRSEFVVADLAIARLGAVKVPINFMLPSSTVATIVDDADVAALVFDDTLAETLTALDLVGNGTVLLQAGAGQLVPGAARLAGKSETPAALPPSGIGPGDSCAIYFTGGTTGRPKGVLHTQRSTVALHVAQLLEAEIAESDRLLLMTPLAHAAGLFAQTAVIRGATILLEEGFEAERALELIEEESATWTFLVPTMLYRMLDALGRKPGRRSSLRTVVYGAAPISPTRLGEALAAFGAVFIQLYGQTECPNWGTRLTKSDHDLHRPERLGSCGKASIHAGVKVVDDDGSDLPPGEIGEICLRSPYTLKEYVKNASATNEKFLGEWIRTGDIGVMDDDGYLYLRDRKNDMVISGGMNVYCREVEDVMAAHPSVLSVAVIGIPHEDWGEAVHACVVPADATLTEADLLAWSRQRLASYARPKTVEFVDSLPETPFGKIDKKVLRAPYWGGRTRAIG